VILTSRDLETGPRAEPKPQPEVSTQVEAKKEEDMKNVFILKSAPPGESSAAFYDEEGKAHQLDLHDRVYQLPEGENQEVWTRRLLRAGFEVVSHPDVPDAKPHLKAHTSEDIVLIHPDNIDSHVIDTKIRVKVGSRFKEVAIVNGRVNTRDRALVEVLMKRGYLVENPHTLEREDSE
jgi:hypothetical protein